ncbi:MAG: hypothetical protein IT213_11570 [Cytophagales bacterium]|nr:hypothetical protein [Cytophagales bacterium]
MRILILLVLIFSPVFGHAQTKISNDQPLLAWSKVNPQEKIFIHTDKNLWISGETSWFKVYLVNGQSHKPSNTSRVVYLELINSESQAVLQAKVELTNGFGKGQFNIPPSISSGNYYLRAYTRWMKNYSSDFFYHQPITLINTFRRLFDTPEHSNSDIDIQFFPEGGQWIEGLTHKMAFRAIDYTGKGIDFSGTIVDRNQDTVTRFTSHKFGIGTFNMTPEASQEYTALIPYNGKIIPIKLPTANPSGFAMQVTNNQTEFIINLQAKGLTDQSLFFLVHTRTRVKKASSLSLQDGRVSIHLSKSELDAGISHITIFTSTGIPVCERLVFVKPTTRLQVLTDREQTHTRKKITLTLNSETANANLSVSVMRDDSLQQFTQSNIVSYLLLSSDLKGTVESAPYYLDAPDSDIDNLMLTHGWSRFKWKELPESKPLQYLPEYRAHLIEAIVQDKQTQLPISGVTGYISAPRKKIELTGAISDTNGLLRIEANLIGTNKLILQSHHAQAVIGLKSPFASIDTQNHLPPIRLSEKNTSALVDKTVSMQVTDTFGKHQDSISPSDSSAFYGIVPETYLLDDYTRFPVMEEVMREYVKNVWVRKKGDQFIFKIVDRDRGEILENESLVLLDGVPIFNVNDIMALDPVKIKQLDVVPARYFVGSLAFDGIISYRTYKGDLGGFKFNPETVILDYEGLQQYKEFYAPRYETVPEINSRIPDARHLLYWNPDVRTNGKAFMQLEFYTSDQPGIYRVYVQGIAEDGTPLFGETSFNVVR